MYCCAVSIKQPFKQNSNKLAHCQSELIGERDHIPNTTGNRRNPVKRLLVFLFIPYLILRMAKAMKGLGGREGSPFSTASSAARGRSPKRTRLGDGSWSTREQPAGRGRLAHLFASLSVSFQKQIRVWATLKCCCMVACSAAAAVFRGLLLWAPLP